MKLLGTYRWPKELPPLTKEQAALSDDFMQHWHERLGKSWMYTMIEGFNHGYPVRTAPRQFRTTLEIGAGLGEHMFYEQLTPEQRRFYYALELRPNMVEVLRERVPDITAFCGDCQRRLDFPDNYFDRILAIHVLEHLPNLPAAVREMHRLCKKDGGIFSVVIPCEGGLMYQIGRILSAKRIFERRYKQSYDWLITREHINSPAEVIQVLERYFEIIGKEYFPFFVPITTINLCIGLRLKPR